MKLHQKEKGVVLLRVYSYSVVVGVVEVLRPRVYGYSVVVLRRPI